MAKKKRDPIGMALSGASSLAGNRWLDKLGLRKPAERVAYEGTRAGFQVLQATQRELKRLRELLPGARLPATDQRDLFDLNLNEDQQQIVDLLRRFAADEIRPRASQADDEACMPAALHEAAKALQLSLYAVPAALGGAAEVRSPTTSLLIAEQLAHGDMGLAVVLLSSFSAAQAISRWGTEAQQQRFLPLFLEKWTEKRVEKQPAVALALDEAQPMFDVFQPQVRAQSSGTGFILNGEKIGVPQACNAELILISAHLEGSGPRVFLIPGKTNGLKSTAEPMMGLRSASTGRLHLDHVAVSATALLGARDEFDFAAFVQLGSLMRGALAVGTAQAVLDYVIPYCNDRHAFGEPISHRQAVAFMISDMAIEIDSMRLLLWRAASRLEQGLPAARAVALAQLLCHEKAVQIGSQGIQLLGGHGFIKEHPVERWYRDLRAIATLHGGLHA